MVAIVKNCYDNTEDGVPNYSIDLIDGTRLYARGQILNPMPKKNDIIDYTEVNVKTSKNGNQYTNVKDVKISKPPNESDSEPINSSDPLGGNTFVSNGNSNNSNKKLQDVQTRQRMDIFVTGVVGRSMGSGHFSVTDINDLTKNAVQSFNENLKEL